LLSIKSVSYDNRIVVLKFSEPVRIVDHFKPDAFGIKIIDKFMKEVSHEWDLSNRLIPDEWVETLYLNFDGYVTNFVGGEILKIYIDKPDLFKDFAGNSLNAELLTQPMNVFEIATVWEATAA